MATEKKEILLGVTGSIAAFRAPDIVRECMRRGVDVTVIMTKNACRFVTPLTFSTLSNRETRTEMFVSPGGTYREDHIALRDGASLLAIAPATANIIGKLRAGIADDLLTTTALSMKGPVLVAPAMNTVMYENAAVRENISALKKRGVHFVEPEEGGLACGDTGVGRLAAIEKIVARIMELLE